MGTFLDFIKNNFSHAAPILAAGILALTIILDRARALFVTYPLRDMPGFFDRLNEYVFTGKMSEAVAFCDRHAAKPAARVIKQALLRADEPEELLRNAVELSVNESIQALQKRTSFLAMIANVATLLGLFGTIAGLISSFEAVGSADAQQKSALLADGISTAMNATMMGLGVAIPCMVAFSFLIQRQNQLISEVDQAALRIFDLLKARSIYGEKLKRERPVTNGALRMSEGERMVA